MGMYNRRIVSGAILRPSLFALNHITGVINDLTMYIITIHVLPLYRWIVNDLVGDWLIAWSGFDAMQYQHAPMRGSALTIIIPHYEWMSKIHFMRCENQKGESEWELELQAPFPNLRIL